MIRPPSSAWTWQMHASPVRSHVSAKRKQPCDRQNMLHLSKKNNPALKPQQTVLALIEGRNMSHLSKRNRSALKTQPTLVFSIMLHQSKKNKPMLKRQQTVRFRACQEYIAPERNVIQFSKLSTLCRVFWGGAKNRERQGIFLRSAQTM